MARIKEYVIDLTPIPWRRAGRHDKRIYDTQTHEKLAVGLYLNQQHGDDPQFVKPIHMDITFFMPIPKSVKKRRATLWHKTIPDLDNLQKFLLDSITRAGAIWRDDSIVSSILAQKVYDQHPHTYLKITELE